MKKPSLFLILVLVSVCILLVSCDNKEQVADEIVEYHNEKWIPISNFKKDETEKLTNEFIKLDSKKDKTEATELIKNEIIPLNEDVVWKLENVDPKNKETKKINDLQLKAEEFALEIFNNIIKYYEGEMTESELAKDKQKLDSMYDDVIEYQDKVFEKYNLKKSDEKIGNFSKLEKADEK